MSLVLLPHGNVYSDNTDLKPMKMYLHGQADVRGDNSPLMDYLVEYIDSWDITVICMLRKALNKMGSGETHKMAIKFLLDILNNIDIIK